MKFVWVQCVVLSAGLALGGVLETQEEVNSIERAHAATDEIRANFKKALKEAMAKGGPQNALKECKVEAPKLTKGKGEVTAVGRTSLRLRNPKNAPPEWVKPYLEKFSKTKPYEIPKQTVVKLSHQHYGYLEPIIVEAICLNCHGKNLSKDLRETIRASYPQDNATDFSAGDFRGLLWLEMKTR